MVLDEVQSKLDVLRSTLEQLDRIPLATLEEFSGDFRNVEILTKHRHDLPRLLHLLLAIEQA